MTSYTPEFYYGAIHDANGRWTGQSGLVPWPAHLRPRELEPLPDVDLKSLFGESSGVELTKKGEAYAEKVLAEAGGVFFLTLSKDDRAGIAYTIERLINILDDTEPDPDFEPYLAGSHQGGHTDDREGEEGSVTGGTSDDEPSLGWTSSGHMGEEHPPMFGVDGEMDDADDEPMLGAPERHPWSQESPWGRSGELRREYGKSQEQWAAGASAAKYDDCEDASEDEGCKTGDDEPSLGWQDEGSQQGLLTSDADYEADLGTTEEIDQVRRLELADHWMVSDSEPDLGWAESFGKGVVGPQNCLDDREHEDERECDPAEHGIADADAVHSEEFMLGGWTGDGAGTIIARNLLRKANGQLPLVENATKLPDDTIVRRFEPRDDNVVIIPEISLQAHYRAANGQRPC